MSASCATRRLRVSAPLPLGSTERQLEPVLVHLPRLGAHSKLPRTLDEMIQTLCAPLHVARVLARIFALYRRCELLQPQPDGAGRPIWVPQLDPRFTLQSRSESERQNSIICVPQGRGDKFRHADVCVLRFLRAGAGSGFQSRPRAAEDFRWLAVRWALNM